MKNKGAENLSVEEIRFLLVDKRRSAQNIRLGRFRETGRVRRLVSETDILENPKTGSLPSQTKNNITKNLHHSRFDILLLNMEIVVIVGLITIVASGWSLLNTLNRSVAASFGQLPLQPTAIIREVVLPDGHTPPNSPGGSKPNDAEIPAHLRPEYSFRLICRY